MWIPAPSPVLPSASTAPRCQTDFSGTCCHKDGDPISSQNSLFKPTQDFLRAELFTFQVFLKQRILTLSCGFDELHPGVFNFVLAFSRDVLGCVPYASICLHCEEVKNALKIGFLPPRQLYGD